MKRSALYPTLTILAFATCPTVCADAIVIDKIYHPYVQPLEQEFEWRASLQNNQPGRPDKLQHYRFAYGRSLGNKWFVEAYVVGQDSDDTSFDIEGYALEAQRQLTEQGQYWADFGVVFELEKKSSRDAWEFSSGLLAEKEWGKWSGTANLFLMQEWGSDVNNKLDSQLGLQARYRHARGFEPALEFYSGKDTRGIGPAAMGQVRLNDGRQIAWEAGIIFGVGSKSPDATLRFLLEFEF